MAWRLAKSVEQSLNQLLLREGKQIKIEDLFCRMNTTLTGDPVFYEGILAFPLDGTFINTEGHSIPLEPTLPNLPLFISESTSQRAQLQVIVA